MIVAVEQGGVAFLLRKLLALLLLDETHDGTVVEVAEVFLLDLRLGLVSELSVLLEQQVVRRRDVVVLVCVQAPDYIVLLVVEVLRQVRRVQHDLLVICLIGLLLAAEQVKYLRVDWDLRQTDEDTTGNLLVLHLIVPWMLPDVRYGESLRRVRVQYLVYDIFIVTC